MRPAKVPSEVVVRMVWESLCERMDPETHLVRPSWLMMMRKIHVCRQRIADAVDVLKADGRIKVVGFGGDGPHSVCVFVTFNLLFW